MTSEAVNVVQEQVEAYNRGDAVAFAATYATDANIYQGMDTLWLTSSEQIQATYTRAFAGAPNVHVEIDQRIAQGNFVIDREIVTGLPNGQTAAAVAIYEVREGRIQNAWLLQ